MKLLLVDDESDFRDTLLKRMQRRNVDVHGVESGDKALSWLDANPADVVILDAPAATYGSDLTPLLRRADALLVPVLPSPIDMRAATRFIEALLKTGRVSRGQTRIALMANRVREHTRIYRALEAFLNDFDIPLLTHLRESQNYIRAAETGLGLFELAPSQVAEDVVQWDPVIEWLQKG